MKKLFLCVATALCSTFAFADEADLVVNPVTITNGVGTMEVVVNKTGTTAFQFDVKLPANVSATAFGLDGAPATRKFEKAHYNANDNTWRFLSYDENNATFDGGTTFNISLAAADGATTSEAETSEILLVDPDGNGTDVDGGNVAVMVGGVSITLSSGATTLVSGYDLDFSDAAVKAYIVTGYDLNTNNIVATRVTDVPAETPIVILGDAENPGPHLIPFTTSYTYYPENYLKGYSDASYPVDKSGNFLNMRLKSGAFTAVSSSTTAWDPGKCYLQIPATVTSAVSEANIEVTMPSSGYKTYIGNYDLDFTGVDVKAYTVTGYDKNNKVWVTRVKNVSANTPLLLWGESNKKYEIPSSEQQLCYINMLRGDANNSTTIMKEADGYRNLVLKSGQFKGLTSASSSVGAGQCYLPVPLSILVQQQASSRGEVTVGSQIEEAEVIYIKLGSISGDDETTGIRLIDEGKFSNDVWYNLNGQRIDTPTKKGLYIKNGKKVLVK